MNYFYVKISQGMANSFNQVFSPNADQFSKTKKKCMVQKHAWVKKIDFELYTTSRH